MDRNVFQEKLPLFPFFMTHLATKNTTEIAQSGQKVAIGLFSIIKTHSAAKKDRNGPKLSGQSLQEGIKRGKNSKTDEQNNFLLST